MKAKSKPMQEMNLAALGLKSADVGAKVRVERFTFPPKRQRGKR